MTTFRAYRIRHDGAGHRAGFETMDLDELSPGEVLVRTEWSSVNYKDALAGTGKGNILRTFPLNGGIDVAGTVVASTDPRIREGDAVLATGSGLSETRDGGYGDYVRLPADRTIALPATLTCREAMIIGTAGFTAALALLRMTDNGQRPAHGPIAITGATGGVGMLGIDIFTRAGYDVHAITSKPDRFDVLRSLGASLCLDRHRLDVDGKPLGRATYGGVLDSVGGAMLAGLLPRVVPYGNAALCGMVTGVELNTTAMPFILRGVSLLGIASAGAPRAVRDEVWARLAGEWKPRHLDTICTKEVALAEVADAFAPMLDGKSFGRTVVRIEA